MSQSLQTQVFLSATLANATEFAAWVAGLHKQPCHVVYTDYRPTPLQHYAFPIGGNGLYAVSSVTWTVHTGCIPDTALSRQAAVQRTKHRFALSPSSDS